MGKAAKFTVKTLDDPALLSAEEVKPNDVDDDALPSAEEVDPDDVEPPVERQKQLLQEMSEIGQELKKRYGVGA